MGVKTPNRVRKIAVYGHRSSALVQRRTGSPERVWREDCLLTSVQAALADVLHHPVGHQVPDRQAVSHALPAVR